MLRSRRSSDDVGAQVTAIWSEVLGVDPAICDDFFDAGGSSLAAVEIAARTTGALGVEVSPATIFGVRTLGAYAQVVHEARGERVRTVARRRDREALTPWEAEVWALGHYDRGIQPIGSEAITLEGRLDISALEWAFTQLVDRHEVLRTVYVYRDHAPRARILAGRPVQLTATPVPPRALEQTLEQLERQPLDLEVAPPWRVSLLRVRPTTHVLTLVLHEILADGEGYGVLLRDLSRLYEGRLSGTSPPRPAMQYRDAAHLPRTATRDAGRRHWSAILRDGRLTLPLPPETGGVRIATVAVAHASIRVSDSLDAALVALAREVAVTPFMAYLASYLLLLHRWSGESVVAVKTAAANRALPEQQEVAGVFSRLVPIEVDVGACHGFGELLERTRTTVIDAFRYADELPVTEPIRRVRGVRQLHGDLPSFRLRDRSVEHGLQFPGVVAKPRARNASIANRLHMDVRRREGRPAELGLTSDAGWSSADLRHTLNHWQELLTAAVAHPDAWEDRRQRATANGGRPQDPPSGPATLPELVARQLARVPDAPAIEADGATVTYAALDERAAAMAARLQADGVARESVVELRHAPSLQLVIALLAVMRLEATSLVRPTPSANPLAFAPLDPDAPDESVLVATGADAGEGISAGGAEGAAVVVWTAGIGGRARAVALTHRTLGDQAVRARTVYRLGRGDRVLQLPGAGPWTWALSPWAALAAGATVVIPRSQGDASAQDGVTVVALPPRAAPPWLESQAGRSGSLRLLRLQGPGAVAIPDSCDRSLVLMREYGTTEAGGVVIAERVDPEPRDGSVGGAPWQGVDVCAGGAPLPAGGAGELCVHVDGVSIATADLAVCRRDGTVRFLGRAHDQVRVRGFRLGPAGAHLEEVLLRHPAVDDAAAVWLPASEALVACVTSARSAADLAADVLAWINEHSDSCICPVACVVLDAIPRRADGSPDRVALAETVQRRWKPRDSPRDSTERSLLKLWRKVLDRRDVGVEDNFFTLGGTLVTGVELASRARAAGIDMSPQVLLNAPTVAETAALVNASRRKPS